MIWNFPNRGVDFNESIFFTKMNKIDRQKFCMIVLMKYHNKM